MTKTELTETLLRAFPDADVEVTDLTGTSDHYQARIVSDAFQGKSRIQQHRMVYAALGDAMGGAVHALALQTSPRAKT
ncbi:MAG TPA: BolA family transcriptional regulator [Polyangiaceae bacterium]|nr:BolA family transcriptional regulator [Polyangiaceae bacterium]